MEEYFEQIEDTIDDFTKEKEKKDTYEKNYLNKTIDEKIFILNGNLGRRDDDRRNITDVKVSYEKGISYHVEKKHKNTVKKPNC